MNKMINALCMIMFAVFISMVTHASNALWLKVPALSPVEIDFVSCFTQLGLDVVPAATMSNEQIMNLKRPTCSSSADQGITPEEWEKLKKDLIRLRATEVMQRALSCVYKNPRQAEEHERGASQALTRAELVARARAMRRR